MNNYKYKMKKMCNILAQYFNEYTIKFKENEKKYLWIMGMFYKVFLDIYYICVISICWSVDGLVFFPSAIKYFVSWILYYIGYCLIMKVENHIVFVFLQLQWILTIAPTIVILGVQENRSIMYIVYILLVLTIQTFGGKSKRNSVPISFGTKHLNQYVTVGLCIVIASVWLVMIMWNDFAGIKAFNLTYIYEMRSKLVYPPMFGYIVSWVTRAIIPWLFILGLNKKNIFLVIYSVFFQFVFYMILGHKAPLLLMCIIVVVYIASKFDLLVLGTYLGMLCGMVIGTIGGCLEIKGKLGIITGINSLLGERTLFVPALIKHQFYEFFSKNPKQYFADGMIGKMLSQTNLYKCSSGFVVYAHNHQGSLAAEANTGYLADSYAQMGIIGMLLIGILVILIVKFISSYSAYMSTEMLCCIVASFCVLLNDGAFFTILLTGGIWIFLIMLTIYTKRGNDND